MRRTSLVAIAALVAGGALAVPSTAVAKRAGNDTPPAATTGFRTVQANMKSPNTRRQFLADMQTVGSLQPDFATLNEVGRRSIADMTLPGYDVFTTPTNYYTGSNAVIWRTDRWTKVASGMAMINNKREIPRGRHTMLGLRYANWVTLRSDAGRTVSVVSVHFVPIIRQWPVQIPGEVRRLGNLVNTLATAGPVIAGGDLNMGYRSHNYPRAQFDRYHLVSTFDLLGASPRGGTGNHHGNTIDYTLIRQDDGQFTPTGQFTTDLKSDHDALVTDWRFNAPAPTGPVGMSFPAATVHNDPARGKKARRAAIRMVHQAISHAPPGSAIHLKTGRLNVRSIVRALRNADHRGVKVQVVQRGKKRTNGVLALRRQLGTNPPNGDWFAGCHSHACRKANRKMARTVLLVSRSGVTPAVRVRLTRTLTRKAISRPTTAKVTNDLRTYNAAFHNFFALVGGY